MRNASGTSDFSLASFVPIMRITASGRSRRSSSKDTSSSFATPWPWWPWWSRSISFGPSWKLPTMSTSTPAAFMRARNSSR